LNPVQQNPGTEKAPNSNGNKGDPAPSFVTNVAVLRERAGRLLRKK